VRRHEAREIHFRDAWDVAPLGDAMKASDTGAPILELDNVSLRFGGVRAMTDVSAKIYPGELFSMIGPNGAGKTSTLNCISGRYRPTAGRILHKGRDITRLGANRRAGLGIGRTFQNLALFSGMTVLDNIMIGRHHLMRCGFVRGMCYWIGGAQREEAEHRRSVEEIIDFLEIQDIRNEHAGTLSYGLRKRVELARAIALKPEVILLDEPMAGMNLEEKEDMARYINDLNEELGMTVVMIEHDMGVVMDLSHRLMVLDFGRKIAEGVPDEIKINEDVKRAYLGQDHGALGAPKAEEVA
jgi:branched-chain amino acid transport system ATP-binding protein